MKDRLKELRKELGLTQEKFAERLKMKRNTIATYEIGRNEPIDAVISLICKEYNVNEEWLRTGKGEMFEKLSEHQKLLKYTGLLLKNKDSAVANAIQTLIVTYEQLDDTSKITLEKIALQYIDNLKKSQ